jgi:hypothetical protein
VKNVRKKKLKKRNGKKGKKTSLKAKKNKRARNHQRTYFSLFSRIEGHDFPG